MYTVRWQCGTVCADALASSRRRAALAVVRIQLLCGAYERVYRQPIVVVLQRLYGEGEVVGVDNLVTYREQLRVIIE